MPGEKVIVLGGAGYIGSHTCRALQAADYTPIIVDNFSRGARELCADLTVEQADILDTGALISIFGKHEAEAVIHFAALIEVGESVKYPDAFFKNNVEGTRSVLTAMHETGIDKIVFSSTAAVYGQVDTDQPLSEDLPLNPINPYGQSKLAAEWLIRDCDEAYGIKSVCLRYFNASGADKNGKIGEAHYPETHLVPLVIQTALAMREEISVFGTDYPTRDGTAVRDYIHVSDLADAHVKAFEYLRRGGDTTYCNLGTGTGYTVNEIIEAVTRISRKNLKINLAERRAGDPAFLVADNAKAQKLLGWSPRRTLDDIVTSAHNWHQSDIYQTIWQARLKAAGKAS